MEPVRDPFEAVRSHLAYDLSHDVTAVNRGNVSLFPQVVCTFLK